MKRKGRRAGLRFSEISTERKRNKRTIGVPLIHDASEKKKRLPSRKIHNQSRPKVFGVPFHNCFSASAGLSTPDLAKPSPRFPRSHAFGRGQQTNLRISYFRRGRVQPRDIDASLRATQRVRGETGQGCQREGLDRSDTSDVRTPRRAGTYTACQQLTSHQQVPSPSARP